jgi:predicted PurR-regulated permease PerM
MELTLDQFLFLVITIAVVAAVSFLIALFRQLRRTAKEGEETLVEIRSLVKTLNQTSQKAMDKIDDVDETLKTAKKTVVQLSEITWFLTSKIIKPSSKYWPIVLPFLRLGWRQWKKRKEN